MFKFGTLGLFLCFASRSMVTLMRLDEFPIFKGATWGEMVFSLQIFPRGTNLKTVSYNHATVSLPFWTTESFLRFDFVCI